MVASGSRRLDFKEAAASARRAVATLTTIPPITDGREDARAPNAEKDRSPLAESVQMRCQVRDLESFSDIIPFPLNDGL